jgi:hypothetical protein
LKVSIKCGFSPCARQWRDTLDWLTSSTSAMLRVLHCVACGGAVCVVSGITPYQKLVMVA